MTRASKIPGRNNKRIISSQLIIQEFKVKNLFRGTLILAILVGGFGIANIMFVSVKERTSIIGIQKSLGAKNYFILLQFLSEAVILSLIGGVTGLILVFPLSIAATNVLEFNFTLSQSNVIFGLMISAVIGMVSGVIPAYVASRMNPVDAIRAN